MSVENDTGVNILSCKECKSEAILIFGYKYFWVQCTICEATGDDVSSKENAVKSWNNENKVE